MSARQRMTMRAHLERSAGVAVDSYGHTEPEVYAALSTTPCWCWVDREETVHDGASSHLVTRLKAIVPLGTDVNPSDKIDRVEDRRLSDDLFGACWIDAVIRRRDHLELTMTARGAS